MNWHALFGGLVACISLTACDDRWKDYNYKMTVYVGDKAYSTVRHVEVTEGASIQDSSGRRVDRKTTGEAVVIETPSGPVFALMVSESGQFGNGFYAAYVAEPALVPAIGKPPMSDVAKTVDEWREGQPGFDALADDAEKHNAMLTVKGPRDLPPTIPNRDRYRGPRAIPVWPMFVRFGDINDPRTVRKVSPGSIGVTRITVEVTGEDVTTGIEKFLPWRKGFGSGRLNGSRFGKYRSNHLDEQLTAYSFSSESAE